MISIVPGVMVDMKYSHKPNQFGTYKYPIDISFFYQPIDISFSCHLIPSIIYYIYVLRSEVKF